MSTSLDNHYFILCLSLTVLTTIYISLNVFKLMYFYNCTRKFFKLSYNNTILISFWFKVLAFGYSAHAVLC